MIRQKVLGSPPLSCFFFFFPLSFFLLELICYGLFLVPTDRMAGEGRPDASLLVAEGKGPDDVQSTRAF